MAPSRSFASDNNAGIHPNVLRSIEAANQGHAIAYGDDHYTRSAEELFKRQFGDDIEVFFVFNGTAANCLALKALTRSYHGVICGHAAHIQVDECGAPEKFTGCKLIPVETVKGKVTVEAIRRSYEGIGIEHHVQPRVVSITQATEVGTVYRPEELASVARFAHEHEMFLHVDGARIANAAAGLGASLRATTRDVGVDVLSFGATKNGAMGAEAVVFFRPERAKDFKFYRKQAMQLASKMRFVSAQFEALFADDLWLSNARHSNQMARLLEREARQVPGVRIVYEVEANGVFAEIPRPAIERLQKRYFFYVWDEQVPIVRWMCSWDTSEADVHDFIAYLRQSL